MRRGRERRRARKGEGERGKPSDAVTYEGLKTRVV